MTESDINFEPIPKRFMVWDKINKSFNLRVINGAGTNVYSLHEVGLYGDDDNVTVVQSTNLFDQNGKEIFEGSLLQTDKEGVGYVYIEDDGRWSVLFESSIYSLWSLLYAPNCKLVGHILSNPELLEGK